MQAKGTTDYKSGFHFAFNQLLNVCNMHLTHAPPTAGVSPGLSSHLNSFFRRQMSPGPTAIKSSCCSPTEERTELRTSSCNTTGPTKRLVPWTPQQRFRFNPAFQKPSNCFFFLFFSTKVRVFTFSVGQHNYDVTPLQWIACTNKGESEVLKWSTTEETILNQTIFMHNWWLSGSSTQS